MKVQTDQQLLRDYAERQSEAAFAELVRRHIDLVHSATMRMVCDSHLAKDVTQAAFIALAQNARQLTDRPVLSGWLHRTAQNIASKAVRTDVRRRAREQEAVAMNELLAAEPDVVWEHLAPHLDAAIGELSEPDRDALLLRYFERKSAREMAQTLGTSEEAAQKRVSRAVERLREFFAKRGVTVGASGLAVVISANAVHAAPVGLAVTISTAAALAGTTIAATTIATMNWITVKTVGTIVAAALTAGMGTYLLQQREANRLWKENQTLVAQREKLTSERDAALSASTANNEELEHLRKNQTELLRLRGQILPLQRELRAMSNHIAMLAQTTSHSAAQAGQTPDVVEETNQVFLDYIHSKHMSDAGVFAAALREFVRTHAGKLPDDLSQVETLADSTLPEGFSQQFELMRFGTVAEEVWPYTFIACEKEPRQLSDGRWMRVYIPAKGGETIFTGIDGMTEADWLAIARRLEEEKKQQLWKEQGNGQH